LRERFPPRGPAPPLSDTAPPDASAIFEDTDPPEIVVEAPTEDTPEPGRILTDPASLTLLLPVVILTDPVELVSDKPLRIKIFPNPPSALDSSADPPTPLMTTAEPPRF
jgi:hypothetical protein